MKMPGKTFKTPRMARAEAVGSVGQLLAPVRGMSRSTHLTIAIAIGFVTAIPFFNGPASGQATHARLSPEARLVAIRRAQVWTPTKVSAMDLKAGPQGAGALAPNATVTCDYVEKKMDGRSPKFTCRAASGAARKIPQR